MTIRFLLAATMALTAGGLSRPNVPADVVGRAMAPGASLATMPRAAWQADDPADSLYRAAREALNRGDYRVAARTFAQIAEKYPSSTYAADALYWEAYSHYSVGEPGELRAALRALEAQKARFPKAATRGDADALAVRVRGALARAGDNEAAQSVAQVATQGQPCGRRNGDERDDERVAALNALLQMNADQAMPILKQVLARRDACSASLREKALFLVSQKHTPETEGILLDVVRTDPDEDVRKKAVFWLGQVNSDRAAQALESMLASNSTSEELREQAVFALMQQNGDRGSRAVRAIAQDASAPTSLREKAVFWLGQKHSPENATFLRDLFTRLAASKSDTNDEVAQKILFSLSQMRGEGNDRWLMDIAASQQYSADVRKQAVFSAGQAGVSSADLVALYDRAGDAEVKGQVIWVLSMKNETTATNKLIDIAKRDPDVQMRKKAIFWLGQSHDPRVKQLLLDIINGG
ncbi:MAG TPA: HEAT repeat domain-containing protein [Gemmatimonadaceae bacterium]|nr:HEAT repeat domain-containing protein [Gemmatimonadaceae bacterium]